MWWGKQHILWLHTEETRAPSDEIAGGWAEVRSRVGEEIMAHTHRGLGRLHVAQNIIEEVRMVM